jgi:amidohydrolase
MLMWTMFRIGCFGLALQACAAHVTQAQSAGFDRFWQGAEPGYLALYRELHRQPELALHEEKTSERAAEQLRRFGYDVTTRVGGFGVVAVLKNGPGRTVLVRGDMDGLPVAEETGLAFASQQRALDASGKEVPVMHACGHDLHLTNLLATAEWLAAQRATWRGTLMIVAQPAEEIGEGARSMIADKLFERFGRPDYALALHVEPELASGHVGIVSGWAAANTDSVDVELYGRGGHGSRPQDAVDPIVLAAQYIVALQTLVSRRNDPQQPAVVTVGSIHGGSKHSIIPDSVHLQLTVRSYSDATRAALLDGIRQLAVDLSTTFRAPKPPTIAIKESYTPAVWNDPKLAGQAREWLGSALGKQAVENFQPQMSGEDFGRYGRELKIPSLLLRVGATPAKQLEASHAPGATPVPGLHSSKFVPDAPLTLRTGVRVLSTLVAALLPRTGAP